MGELQEPSLVIRDAALIYREIAQSPEAFVAFLKANREHAEAMVAAMRAAGIEMGNVTAPASVSTTSRLLAESGIIRPSDIRGKSIIGAGVLLDTRLTATNGNSMPLRVLGFLGSENGEPLRATFNEASTEITINYNNGLVHGTGTQQDNVRALETGDLKPGTIILATYEALRELAGTYGRRGQDGRLRTDTSLKAMNDIIARGSNVVSWAVSGREDSGGPWGVDCVRLRDGHGDWSHKNYIRGLVVALQCG
jgi:hypothetical protein